MTSLEEGFVKGQSDNLPQVDNITMFSFLGKHPDFMGAEMKGVKAKRTATARGKAEQADKVAKQARAVSTLARMIANKYAPEFQQPVPQQGNEESKR